MIKKDVYQYSTDINCPWCAGSGIVSVPDYSLIGRNGYLSEIMAGIYRPNVLKAVFCHECYPEPPFMYGEIRHKNLRDHLAKVRKNGIGENLDLFIHVLHHGFDVRGNSHQAGEMIAQLLNPSSFEEE